MKKLILSLVAALALSFSANAQSKFNKGDFALNVNYGLGAFTDNDWDASGSSNSVTQHSIGVMGEYGIMNVINERGTISVGGQFGMGAEVAISTQKLHARGPMALQELTTYQYVCSGDYIYRH